MTAARTPQARSGQALRIGVDPAAVSPSRVIAETARIAPLLVLTGHAFADLIAELGGPDAAWRQLLRIATNVNRPIGVNLTDRRGHQHHGVHRAEGLDG